MNSSWRVFLAYANDPQQVVGELAANTEAEALALAGALDGLADFTAWAVRTDRTEETVYPVQD